MNATDLQMLAKLRSIASQFEGDFLTDLPTRQIYATDASVYQELPLAVAIPRNEADIEQLIRFASQTGISLIPRTAGTSLAGQVVGSGIVVDVSKYFTRIIEVNAKERWARVQPGVIRNELNLNIEKHGLLFGPETSTGNRAMLGGMLGNNSCGSNSIVYGSMRDQLLELKGFLSDGSFVTLGDVNADELSVLTSCSESLENRIYSELIDAVFRPQVIEEIRRHYPKATVTRRNTGYAMDSLIDCQPFRPDGPPLNLCRLIAGSEGTLFFATELKLRCQPLPPKVAGLLCVHFRDVDEALRATLIAMRFQPYACELIDRLILEGAARNIAQRRNLDFVSGNPGAILVIEFRGDDADEVLKQSARVESELRSVSLGYHFPTLFDPDAKKVWELRRAGLGVVSNVPGDSKPCTVIEDTAVAIEDLPAYIAEIRQLLKVEHDLECVHYAHAGAGEIHLRPILNLKTPEGRKLFRQVATEVAHLVKKWNGSLSGEHGDGRLRGEFLPLMIGPKNYELCRKIKSIFDPDGILNPGKIVDAPPMDQALRASLSPTLPQTTTFFDFSDTHGFLGAAEMCSGSGDCRKTHLSGGTMCPSYMATRREYDSTRARANMLRHAMSQPENANWQLDNSEVKKVLDLCLSCKACKSECPSNVDMAKMKAEFTQAYHDRHGVPLRTRIIASYASLNRIAAIAPKLYNFAASNSFMSRIIKASCGFHPRRSLPKLGKQTLRRWFARHIPDNRVERRGRVTFFCDEFTNFHDVDVGIAAIELLEKLGYEVNMVDHMESGRAAISKGLLRRARRCAEFNVSALSKQVQADCPLVGVEPSALLSFRDEYPMLLRGEQAAAARQLAQNSLLIDEFIAREMLAGKIGSDRFVQDSRLIRLHGHCHQKAIASMAPTVQMLQLPKNYRVKLIPSGCCGMAGSFGYEKEHFDLANEIGELVLMPTIRSEPAENLIAAAGTSCRHQILDATGRKAFHPAQILRDALRPEP